MSTNIEEEDFNEKVPNNRNKYLWIVLISLGSLIYAACYVFPPTVKIQNQLLTECPTEIYKDLGYSCGQYDSDGNPTFALKMDDVQDSDQFIHLKMAPYLSPQAHNKNDQEGAISRTFPFRIEKSIYAISTRNHLVQKIHQEQKEFHFICTNENENAPCTPQIIGKVNDIQHTCYIFIFKIFNTKELQERHVEDIRLSLVSFNYSFHQCLKIFKWVLFIISLISYVLYNGIVSSLPKGFASDEQSLVKLLALSMILFTQPIIQSFEHKHFYLAMVRVIGIAIPNSLIILFWLYLLQILASSDGISESFKRLAKFIALIHFMVITYVYGSLASEQVTNILIDFNHSTNPHIGLSSYYFTGFSICMVIWSAFKLFMILLKLKDLSWRGSPALVFTLCLFAYSLFFTWSHSLDVQNLKNSRIALLYGIPVLYSVLLQTVYAPVDEEIKEAERKRKYENPQASAQYGDLDDSGDVETPNIELRNADEMNNKTEDEM